VESSSALSVRRAACRAVFVFDAGREIDLAVCAVLAKPMLRPGTEMQSAAGPVSVHIEPPPVRLNVPFEPFDVAGRRVEGTAEAAAYDFGALAVTITVPAEPDLAALRRLASALTGNAAIAAAARAIAHDVCARIAGSISGLALDEMDEEYLVFEITDFSADRPLAELPAACAREFASILRTQAGELSDDEAGRATATWVMQTPNDLALIDWDAALLLHERPDAVRHVLELANVQLLEMRFLDGKLDRLLHAAYDVVSQRTFLRPVFLSDSLREAMRRIAQRQVDAAILFERVSNALKLVGDQYLARVYRGASKRFELDAWHAANVQKLATLDGIYQKLHDRAVSARATVLEWIIILLIAAEIVLGLVRL
jgi:hypothetical protein